MLRLSRNARMDAVFAALDQISVSTLLSKATCRGAKRSLLRERYTYVMWEGLRAITQYNRLRDIHPLEATTHFGAAFAIACSNEEQSGTSRYLALYTITYGLLRDCTPLVTEEPLPEGNAPPPTVAESTQKTPKVMTHRFEMNPPAVEIGLISRFGMSMPNDGWVDFEAMLCSLLYLAFSAVCAGSLGITLSDVDCKSAALPAAKADPIAQIKTWIRLHASCDVQTSCHDL